MGVEISQTYVVDDDIFNKGVSACEVVYLSIQICMLIS